MVVTYNNTTITTDKQILSTLATGTAPLSIASTTAIANLNSDKLDGYDESAIVREPFWFGYSAALPSNQTNYLWPNGNLQSTDISFYIIKRAGTVRNLYVWSNTASGVGKTDTYTVLKNGTATILTVSLTNVQSNTDLANSFTVVAGDRISVKVVSDTGTAAANISVGFEEMTV